MASFEKLIVIVGISSLDLLYLIILVSIAIYDPYFHFSTTKKHCSSKTNETRYELCKAYHNNVRFAEKVMTNEYTYQDNSQSFLLLLRDNKNMGKIPVDMNEVIYYNYFILFALLTRILTIKIEDPTSQVLYACILMIIHVLYTFFAFFSLKSFYRTDSVRILLNNHVEYKTNAQETFYMVDYNFTTIEEFYKFSKSAEFMNFGGMEEKYIEYVEIGTTITGILIVFAQLFDILVIMILSNMELRVGSE